MDGMRVRRTEGSEWRMRHTELEMGSCTDIMVACFAIVCCRDELSVLYQFWGQVRSFVTARWF